MNTSATPERKAIRTTRRALDDSLLSPDALHHTSDYYYQYYRTYYARKFADQRGWGVTQTTSNAVAAEHGAVDAAEEPTPSPAPVPTARGTTTTQDACAATEDGTAVFAKHGGVSCPSSQRTGENDSQESLLSSTPLYFTTEERNVYPCTRSTSVAEAITFPRDPRQGGTSSVPRGTAMTWVEKELARMDAEEKQGTNVSHVAANGKRPIHSSPVVVVMPPGASSAHSASANKEHPCAAHPRRPCAAERVALVASEPSPTRELFPPPVPTSTSTVKRLTGHASPVTVLGKATPPASSQGIPVKAAVHRRELKPTHQAPTLPTARDGGVCDGSATTQAAEPAVPTSHPVYVTPIADLPAKKNNGNADTSLDMNKGVSSSATTEESTQTASHGGEATVRAAIMAAPTPLRRHGDRTPQSLSYADRTRPVASM